MKKSILPAALLITLLTACQNNSKPANQNDAIVGDTLVHHDEEHIQQSDPVSLNNGEKWAANAETSEGINKMNELIAEFTLVPDTGDYRSLKVKLETEFNLIIQKCTMSGEAHEQLHKYLIPMNEMFKKLNSGDKEVSHSAIVELKQHLSEYKTYFQ